jgi:antitoxin component of MazEF toxin-antitoxin module
MKGITGPDGIQLWEVTDTELNVVLRETGAVFVVTENSPPRLELQAVFLIRKSGNAVKMVLPHRYNSRLSVGQPVIVQGDNGKLIVTPCTPCSPEARAQLDAARADLVRH